MLHRSCVLAKTLNAKLSSELKFWPEVFFDLSKKKLKLLKEINYSTRIGNILIKHN